MCLLFASAVAFAPACGRAPTARPEASPPRAPNLVLVTIDTVRADHLGAYGDAGAATPSLDRLARQGARFTAAWSAVPLTLPSHATILSGLLPPHHGLRNNGAGRLPVGTATLATDLGAAGYRTGAFVGAFVLDHRFGLDAGFDRYDDDIPAAARARAGLDAERPGREVVDRALAWLKTVADGPFFAWVHLYDAHAPYEPPEPFRTRFADRPYDGEIAEVDAEVGRLLAFLDDRGLAARTVVAVAGDHGEALGEHGELTHGLLLYESTLRVPLIVRVPGVIPPGRTVDVPVSLADLAPTLAGLLGHPLAAAGAPPPDGRDLSAALAGGPEPPVADVYAETRYPAVFGWSALAALRRGNAKFIAAPRSELYDLAADPGERDNLLARQPARMAEFTGALAALAAGQREAGAAALDSESRAKLASLGYIAGSSERPPAAGARDPKDMVGLFRAFEEAHWDLVGGDARAARAGLERIVAGDPANPVFIGQLAEACRQLGDYGRAVDLYRKALALAPDDREARYNLAVTLQEAGRQDEAMVALTTAIALDPGRPEAHNALGVALSLKGDLAGAQRELEKAVQLDPRDARAYNNLGNVRRNAGDAPGAESAYRRAAELAPDYADPLNGLGALAVQQDRPLEAVPLFERALTLAPQQQEARLNLAIALELAGRKEEAAQAYRDFLRRTSAGGQYGEQRRAAQQLLARLERQGRS